MKVRLISDTHFEFYEDTRLYPNKGEDVLIIAGDLAVGPNNVKKALSRFETKEVIYVPGNHEYYRHTIEEVDTQLSEFRGFLNPGTKIIGDVTFIGATLWTNFRNDYYARSLAKDSISDFTTIKNFSGIRAQELFEEHFNWIKGAYEAYPGKKVIVTHFLPAIECIHPRFEREIMLNKYFANDLGNWIGNLKNTTWVFGHTHDPVDIKIGDTRVMANPYGYNRNDNYQERIFDV